MRTWHQVAIAKENIPQMFYFGPPLHFHNPFASCRTTLTTTVPKSTRHSKDKSLGMIFSHSRSTHTVYALIHTELIPKESKSVAVILINCGNLRNCNCNFLIIPWDNFPVLSLAGPNTSFCLNFNPSYKFLLKFGPRCRCSSRTWGYVRACAVCWT